MTEKEAAMKLSCSVRTLRQLRHDGKISFMQGVRGKKGSKVTYLEDDIEAFARRFRHPADWALPGETGRPPRNAVKIDADKKEHDAALKELEREFGLKIRNNK